MVESAHYTFKNLEFWAQGGQIHILDLEKASVGSQPPPEAYSTTTPREWIKRAIAVRDFAGDDVPSEARQARRLLEEAHETVKAALQQGDISNPRVLSDIIKMPKKTSLLIPGMKKRIKHKSPRQTLLEGVEVVSEFRL